MSRDYRKTIFDGQVTGDTLTEVIDQVNLNSPATITVQVEQGGEGELTFAILEAPQIDGDYTRIDGVLKRMNSIATEDFQIVRSGEYREGRHLDLNRLNRFIKVQMSSSGSHQVTVTVEARKKHSRTAW